MLLRNKKIIPHGSSRGSSRSPVVCEDTDPVSPLVNLQASTDSNATVSLGKPAGCGDSSSISSRLDHLQATAVETITVHKGVITQALSGDVKLPDILNAPQIFIGPCRSKKRNTLCRTCPLMNNASITFKSTVTQRTFDIISNDTQHLDCSCSNIIYLITCNRCKLQYVGETVQTLRNRMNGHRTAIINQNHSHISQHFNSTCNLSDLIVQPIEIIPGDGHSPEIATLRKSRETFWMKQLRTVYPFGLNDQCGGINWTNKTSSHVTMKIFPSLPTKRSKRGRFRRNKWSSLFSIDNFLNTLLKLFENNDNWIRFAITTIASLS